MVSERIAAADRLAVLCGPTAVGKTAVAVTLAERMGAEIVAADSRTVYRGADVGTAKPTPDERGRVRHHLLDVADPGDAFTLADYQRLAQKALTDIRERGRLPLLVGGTGLYIRAVVDRFSLPPVPPNHALRAALEADELVCGSGHLHARLAALDPVAAARIHPRNVRRVIRALEVVLQTGRPITDHRRQGGGKIGVGSVAMVGLTMERAQLDRRIDARAEAMMASGLEEETRGLLHRGIPTVAPIMQALGYKEIAGWIMGAYDGVEAVRRLKRNTRRYAKRQLTWFRRDARIQWVDATGLHQEDVVERVHAIMNSMLNNEGEA